MPSEVIAVCAVVLIIGGAVTYIIIQKKRGKRCIGCPDSGSCSKDSHACSGSCSRCEGCKKE